MPVFNGQRFLAETLQSVLAQTYQDWELILVDDGSTDASMRVADTFGAACPGKVTCLTHPGHANRGQLASRVLGARHARAGVVALLDQDDVWEPGYLEGHLRLWEDARPRGAALSYGPAREWFPTSRGGHWGTVQDMPSDAPRVFGAGELLEVFLDTKYRTSPCPSCALVAREVFDGVGRFEVSAYRTPFEDQFLWWYAAARWPVAVHPHVWVRYRRHPRSALTRWTASRRRAMQSELAFLRIITEYLIEEHPGHPLVRAGRLQAHTQVLAERVETYRANTGARLREVLRDHLPVEVYGGLRTFWSFARGAWRPRKRTGRG